MKKFLSLVMALAMTVTLVTVGASAKDFTDDSKITYGEAVDVISALGVVDGYTDGSFNPTATLTRGAAAKIICNLMLGPTTAGALGVTSAPFSDVPVSNVFAGYIAYCSSQGIINGYSDGTFKPSATVTGYQFMKMLLGALGYDGSIEGFTGSNWTVNVAKLAVSIGLDDGNDNFIGSTAMTREEAALYAYNTLQATMVTYDTKGTSISVGGVEISTGASSAEDMTNTTKYDGNISDDGLMQFAEKYFTKLVLDDADDTTDDFARPADIWTLDGDEIGTYANAPDATYSANTALGTIYSDLGLTKTTAFAVYQNGIAGDDISVTKGSTTKTAFGNGTTVEVYKDAKLIVVINNYVGQIADVEDATASKDAYVVIDDLSKTAPALVSDEFETTAFAEDDIVVYTYSDKADEIESVAATTSVSGDVDSVTGTTKLAMNGTTYSANVTCQALDSAYVDAEKVIYLDSYGYIVYTDEITASSSNYAYVLSAGRTSDGVGGYTYKAKLVYSDGTIETVVTKNDYSSTGTDLTGQFVTYKTNSSDKVILTVPTSAANTTDDGAILIANGSAYVKVDSSTVTKANSATLFLVYDADEGTVVTYTGIKNVPDVDASTGSVAYLVKTGASYATIVFLNVDASDVSSASSDTLFLVGESKTLTTTSDATYYTYQAIVDDEITTVNVDASTSDVFSTLNGGTNLLLKSYSVDSDGYYTAKLSNKVNSDTAGYNAVGSVTKVSGGVVGLDGNSYVLADDCVFYKISDTQVVTESSSSALKTADVGTGEYYAQVSFALNDDGNVSAIYFELN